MQDKEDTMSHSDDSEMATVKAVSSRSLGDGKITVPKSMTAAVSPKLLGPRITKPRASALLIVVVALLSSVIGSALTYGFLQTTDDGSRQVSTTTDGNKVISKEEEDLSNVVSKVSPSVVSIVTTSQGYSVFRGVSQQEGAGTGIVVSKDGYILTNNHVISGASAVTVILADGTQYTNVKIIGSDPLNDVAYLKIDNVSNLAPAVLGDSSTIRTGQKVIAIGNSLGQYQNTVTSGIISGMGRPVSAQSGTGSVEELTDLIQTDAAINPGNSGGPLLNMQGQVIGVNTAVAEDAQGIGFSIPIDATKGTLKGVIESGAVKRSYLGVNFINITADVARQFGLDVTSGAYVYNESGSAVVAGGPADKAGVQDKDILTKVNGIAVGDPEGLSSIVGSFAPGDSVELTVLRGGKTQTVKVTLGTYGD